MKVYGILWFIFMLVCPSVFISGCIGSVQSISTKSDSGRVSVNYDTNVDGYNKYQVLLKDDVDIHEKIIILIQLSYLGYNLYPDKCLVHIKQAMDLSTKIDHKHKWIGELYILYAKLHKQSNENYDPLPVLKEGVEVLGNYMAREFKKRSPYKDYFKILDHADYVGVVNLGKSYMRDVGYDVGKDKKVSLFYRIDRAIFLRPCISIYTGFYDHTLRNGHVTWFQDIYYYDFLSYYLDLATDGFDILDIPDHRFASFDKPSY